MPDVPYSPNAVLHRNSGVPAALSDAFPLAVVDTGSGSATLYARQDALETAPCDGFSVTGAWTLLAAGSSALLAAGTRTAVRRTSGGPVPFRLEWGA